MLWRKKDCVRIVFGLTPKRMKVVWFIVNGCKSQCTGIVNHATNLSCMTPKTALFDGIFQRKRCGAVIPHRDFSRRYV